jgi:hypothetical protein
MAYSFTKLASKRSRLKEPPTMVSIVKGGKTVTVTRPALELIGAPEAIVYMIDVGAGAFAIVPAESDDLAAYPVRWQDSGRSALISFGNVAAALDLETSQMQRVRPFVQEGMLIVDPNEHRNGHGQQGQE